MRVYIAGKYRSDNIMEILMNIKDGQDEAALLMSQGYHVHCPWLDHQLVFTQYGSRLSIEILQANSMAFLEVCDAVFVLPGWEKSEGTKKEIARAKELNIPVFHKLQDLDNFRKLQEPAANKLPI